MAPHEGPPLAMKLVFLGKHVGHLLERRLAAHGLNRTQVMVLTALHRNPGLIAQDLCAAARVEPANVTRALQSLERLGLLERRPHPTDGRASLFYLTGEGEAMAVELSGFVERLSADLLEGLDPEEVAQLDKLLFALRQAIGRQLLAAGHQPPSIVHHRSAAEHRHGEPGTGTRSAEHESANPVEDDMMNKETAKPASAADTRRPTAER